MVDYVRYVNMINNRTVCGTKILPLNKRMPSSSASFSASLSTVTSKQRIHASSLAFSSMVAARIISFLCTGPMLIPDTGILLDFRKSNRASKDPSVLACTQTPCPDLSMVFSRLVKSDIISSLRSSSSSSGPTTSSREPAMAFSRSGAVNLTPKAAFTSLW